MLIRQFFFVCEFYCVFFFSYTQIHCFRQGHVAVAAQQKMTGWGLSTCLKRHCCTVRRLKLSQSSSLKKASLGSACAHCSHRYISVRHHSMLCCFTALCQRKLRQCMFCYWCWKSEVHTLKQSKPGESYRRRLRSLYLYYVFWALLNSLGCWF